MVISENVPLSWGEQQKNIYEFKKTKKAEEKKIQILSFEKCLHEALTPFFMFQHPPSRQRVLVFKNEYTHIHTEPHKRQPRIGALSEQKVFRQNIQGTF